MTATWLAAEESPLAEKPATAAACLPHGTGWKPRNPLRGKSEIQSSKSETISKFKTQM